MNNQVSTMNFLSKVIKAEELAGKDPPREPTEAPIPNEPNQPLPERASIKIPVVGTGESTTNPLPHAQDQFADLCTAIAGLTEIARALTTEMKGLKEQISNLCAKFERIPQTFSEKETVPPFVPAIETKRPQQTQEPSHSIQPTTSAPSAMLGPNIGAAFVAYCREWTAGPSSRQAFQQKLISMSLADATVSDIFRNGNSPEKEVFVWDQRPRDQKFDKRQYWLVECGGFDFVVPHPKTFTDFSDTGLFDGDPVTPATLNRIEPATAFPSRGTPGVYSVNKGKVILRAVASPPSSQSAAKIVPPSTLILPENTDFRKLIGQRFVDFCQSKSENEVMLDRRFEEFILPEMPEVRCLYVCQHKTKNQFSDVQNWDKDFAKRYWIVVNCGKGYLLPAPKTKAEFWATDRQLFEQESLVKGPYDLAACLPVLVHSNNYHHSVWDVGFQGKLVRVPETTPPPATSGTVPRPTEPSNIPEAAGKIGDEGKTPKPAPPEVSHPVEPTAEKCEAVGSWFVEYIQNHKSDFTTNSFQVFIRSKESEISVWEVYRPGKNAVYKRGSETSARYWLVKGAYCYLLPVPVSNFAFNDLVAFLPENSPLLASLEPRDVKSLVAGALRENSWDGTWSQTRFGKIE
jgi:hypothetical protein